MGRIRRRRIGRRRIGRRRITRRSTGRGRFVGLRRNFTLTQGALGQGIFLRAMKVGTHPF